MSLHSFKIGGIHPPENKLTAGLPIIDAPLPMTATVLLGQHIGAPAECIVAKGDIVKRGQKIGQGKGFITASIHAPISGTVKAIGPVIAANGYPAPAVTITASAELHDADEMARRTPKRERADITQMNSDEIREKIKDAGIVGMGGATFPTHAKLSIPADTKAETLIINACECEPYLTCDDALMRAFPQQIITGTELMLKAAGAPRAVIAVESNKPEAIKALRAAASCSKSITIFPLKVKYPQGGEKQLVEAVTGRRIPSGALPISVGAIVQNVATAYAVFQAIAYEEPLTERIITITGDTEPRGNYRVAIGTPLSSLGFGIDEGDKMILGGPMMGRTAANIDAPVTKGTSGILVISNSRRDKTKPCVSCGACVNACPMGLEPYLLSTYGRLRMYDEAEAADVADCIECGSCSYICPSWRPLLDYIRQAKTTVIANIKSRNSKK